MKIPYLTLILAQQGGIGYPPVIIKLDRWYAVSDSRIRKPPPELDDALEYQRRWLSPYSRKRNPGWHSQEWVYKKWGTAPRLTWDEVIERYCQMRATARTGRGERPGDGKEKSDGL